MKKVLITGSEGFAGQHLWKELESAGFEVYGTTLHQPKAGLPKNVFVCDIESQEQLQSLISSVKPDVIFHLAGQPKPGLSFDIPQKTFTVNTIGTINLLEAIRAIPEYLPRIMMVGTSEEHGIVSPENLPITEKTPLDPINPYAISKMTNWFLAKEYVRSFKFDIVYITPFGHTGPGQMPGFLAPDIASQIAQIEKGTKEPIITTKNLSTRRDLSDVRDVVTAYRLLIEKGVSGERYIISTGKSNLVKDIVEKLISFSNVKIELKIGNAQTRPTDIPDIYGSHEKLTKLTGWEPKIPLDQTLQDLLDWYRGNR